MDRLIIDRTFKFCIVYHCHCFFYNLQTLNIYLMFKAKVKKNYLLLSDKNVFVDYLLVIAPSVYDRPTMATP